MPQNKILVLNSCRHQTAPRLCSIIQANINCDLRIVEGQQDILNLVNQQRPDLIFFIEDEVNTHIPVDIDNLSLIPKILVQCTQESDEQVHDLFPDQIDDYIFTPLRETEVIFRIRRLIVELNSEKKELAKKNLFQKLGKLKIIGQEPAFLNEISKILQISDCDVPVLIMGETGVGKDVCARLIHYLSKRAYKPFMAISCGAMPTNLVENELFGHRKGAFTDARSNQLGIVAEARGGTLFLDEIDTLSMEAQSKLLRLLQEKTYRPLGFTKNIQANIRVISATNVDLEQKVQQGDFRADLFYRINVIPLRLPPLRKRKGDIPLLADLFLRKYTKEYDRKRKSLSKEAIEKLQLYNWPGNIRELENIIQQALLLTSNSIIKPENICISISIQKNPLEKLTFKEAKDRAIEQFERDYIIRLLILCDGNITCAAKMAGKDRGDFSKMMRKYHINAKDYRRKRYQRSGAA